MRSNRTVSLSGQGEGGSASQVNTDSGSTCTPSKERTGVRAGYESTDSILLTEPRIEAIRHELQALLAVVELESDGKPVSIDGFRLRDNSHWAEYPTSLSDIFWHVSSACNFNCEFCYEKGNPGGFPIQNAPRMATPEEIETRLKYYDPYAGKGLFTVRTAINEPFANKGAVEYLRMMRAKAPHELMSFVTNGAYLTEDVVLALRDLQPIFLNVSIYSTNPVIRHEVLGDHRADRAVKAVDLLVQYQVPYMANLVMWPSIPFEDMERTIAYVSERNAVVLRVCLGAYSRYLTGEWERFELDDYWPKVVAEVERIRDRYPLPILIEPNSYVRRDTEAYVDGVVQGSPAQRAGLRRGDRILEVNGKWIGSRMHLLSELRRRASVWPRGSRPPGVFGMKGDVQVQENEIVRVKALRESDVIVVELDRYDPESLRSYPYGQIATYDDFMYGLVITDSLRYSSLRAARQLMESHHAKRVLLLTSPMIEPILAYMLDGTGAFNGFDVFMRCAKNRYFGGTINIGDLLVVQDFIEAIQDFLEREDVDIDLALIPASPFASSPWGRDLTGRPWRDIERVTGVTVDLIPCANITF